MTSMILNFFKNNFFEKCIKDSFLSIDCIIGSSFLFFSIFIFVLNFFAFFKFVLFYGKINFETKLILLSIFQIIVIQLIIITLHEILIVFFTFLQTFIITLIIRKFIIISKQTNQALKKNGFFILLNTINIILFIIYILLLIKNNKDKAYSIILFHICFYSFSCVILAYYSKSLLKLMKKLKLSELQTTSSRTIPQMTNDIEDEKKNNKLSHPDNEEEDKTNSTTRPTNEEKNNSNSNCIEVNNYENYFEKNEIVYVMRKKQIKPLYKVNIICSILEFFLIFIILLLPNDNFEKNQYKIIPKLFVGYIIFYIYIIICLLNAMINFFCFFWKIRGQYKKNLKNRNINKNKIIDNRFIKRTTINMKKENPKQINEFIENDSNPKEKNNEKSLFMSYFTDISEIKDENEFKNKKRNNSEDNNLIEDNKNIKNEKENEIDVNKELLEPLNDNFTERESIPINIDSINGINRNTSFSVSKIENNI